MKKLAVIMAALTLFFGVVEVARADIYIETINLGNYFGGASGTLYGYDGAYFGAYGEPALGTDPVTFNWSFTTPAEFTVPWDTVNSATVSVVVGWADTIGDDSFHVETLSRSLTANTGDYVIDIASLFANWPSGGQVDASLYIVENERWNGDLFLGESTFVLDYTNNTAPVPEPGTMLLLGSGLAGLAVLGRKFKK